jgi:signal transduction histidine kinase/ActR/RegA family two-component response regulator
VRNIQLRTKFLLALLAITAGLTAATWLIVGYGVRRQVRAGVQEDLRNSVNTYQIFEKQREAHSTQSARLIANLPYLRALMTTGDSATIADGSKDIWQLSGSDMMVLADHSGKLAAFQSNTPAFTSELAQELMRKTLDREASNDWWFGGGHLYEVWVQPIYFGKAPDGTLMGYVAAAYEIDGQTARDFSGVSASEVAFRRGKSIVATTLSPTEKSELEARLGKGQELSSGKSDEIFLGSERYMMTTLRLSREGEEDVSLSVLKSLDKASAFLKKLNRILAALGLVSVLAGSLLVFLISKSFMRPLANLVAGVRALEEGDFGFPLERTGGDEVAEVTSAFATMRDNLEKTQTEQRQLEDRLRQAHKMEAVGRLAGGVAHDFNNLLTIIRGHGDLLLDRGMEDGSQRNSVEQIQKAANRAVTMTRQLLAFSRMQVLQPRVLDLNAIVSDMGKMLPRLIGENIEYLFVPGLELGCVKADPGQIEQVILNLAVNARDAMPDGGKILVKTQNVEMDEMAARLHAPMTPGSYVMLSVSDTGIGMDEKTKAHIFEPFFTTKEAGKGTGLGLATVYGVVKQSGGFIWVESERDKGATFEIYLPIATEKISDPEKDSLKSTREGGKETILVVEDEAGVRELACEFLKSSGYSVLDACDGIEALEMVTQYKGVIHLVLTDVVMPRMSGRDLAKRMKQLRPETKTLLMSGYSDHYQVQQKDSKADSVILQKPFSLDSLVGKVREVLSGNTVARHSNAGSGNASQEK